MNANVYSAMNSHPARPAVADSPSRPAVAGRCRWALGELGPEPETSGIAPSQGGVEPAAGKPFDPHARQRGNTLRER
jgi:hypothetical protein